MAHKSKANARQKHTRADQIVVNIYNHGTVNIDARQNKSSNYKVENKGCTNNYPCGSSDYHIVEAQSELAFQIIKELTL